MISLNQAKDMPQDKTKIYFFIVKSMGQILALSKLYNLEHPVVITKANEVFSQLTELITEKDPLVFAESPEATLLVNGEEIKGEDSLTKRFIQDFRSLKLGSLGLKYGLTLKELGIFINLLNNCQKVSGNIQIKEYLERNGALHLEPSFAAYKLVNENEIVLSKNESVKISDIPLEKIDAFIRSFCSGDLNKEACRQDKAYDLLVHDPAFLYKIIWEAPADNSNPDNFIKTMWLIGDYLIGEIDSVKQEELNRKIINELKDKLLAQANDKAISREEIEKALTAINSALQLKGLILLYKKHRKGLRDSENKINRILENLPKNSQLYINTKQELDNI